MEKILSVEHLSVVAAHGTEKKKILHDISFSLQRGEIFAVVGESGSGKSTLTRALTKLFHASTMDVHGTVQYSEKNLFTLSNDDMRSLLRTEIRYLFQEPGQSFNPIARISSQIKNAYVQSAEHVAALATLLSSFGLSHPDELLALYPHQLSIGTMQRILLALALAPQPALLIADEPTSAVDFSLKFDIMDRLRAQSREKGMSILFVTHDLTLAQRYADRIAVLYDGRIVEMNTSAEYFSTPAHPYSQLLLKYFQTSGKNLQSCAVPNEQRTENSAETGCAFHTRCAKVKTDCTIREPLLQPSSETGYVRCLYWK